VPRIVRGPGFSASASWSGAFLEAPALAPDIDDAFDVRQSVLLARLFDTTGSEESLPSGRDAVPHADLFPQSW
jgi:hypothetical protein